MFVTMDFNAAVELKGRNGKNGYSLLAHRSDVPSEDHRLNFKNGSGAAIVPIKPRRRSPQRLISWRDLIEASNIVHNGRSLGRRQATRARSAGETHFVEELRPGQRDVRLLL